MARQWKMESIVLCEWQEQELGPLPRREGGRAHVRRASRPPRQTRELSLARVEVGACKYEIGKEKHGLSPWQLRLAADAIQSFALLYMVIATAGTIWYAVMVKDNYLVNCVLYTAITNTIMSIVVTGPL